MHGGREPEFREYVLAAWPRLVRVAVLVAGDRGLGEDAVQDALARVWRRWPSAARGNVDAYVRRAVVNAALSQRRSRRRREALVPSVPEPAGATADAASVGEEMLAALLRLPPRTRAVLVLRYLEDMAEVDVAQTLDVSVGTVKKLASRGRDGLRELLAASEVER